MSESKTILNELLSIKESLEDSTLQKLEDEASASVARNYRAQAHNPFLPQSIKERINSEHPEFNMTIPPSSPEQKIVEEIIRKYLPIMETELRNRLQEMALEGSNNVRKPEKA